jgi:heme-degrading monooxygenase HmoA
MADRHLAVVLSNSTPGQDAEFNNWYNNTHIPQISSVPGFVRARRYRASDLRYDERVPVSPYQYLTLWDIEGDFAAALAARQEAHRAGKIDMTSAIDLSSGAAWTYEPLGGPRP